VTEAELGAALELKRAGRLDEAVIALEAVLARSAAGGGIDPVALIHLAEVQLRRRRSSEAAEALDRAEAIVGVSAFSARVRGDLHYREKRFAEAARAYREASALGERGTWALVQLGRCCLRTGDLEGARGAAGRAVERDEGAAGAWLILGEAALRQEQLDDALALFERAHRCAPDDDFTYAKLIEARLARLAPEERAREVEVLVRSQGRENRHLLGVLARVRSDGGDPGRAAEVWRERRERHPGDLYAREMEAYALRKAGQLDRAAGLFRACLMDDPENLILFRTYVHLQRQRGALDELRESLEQLIPVAGSRRGAVYGELRKLGPA
jgi:tetratricopeptide (TPR) repeat protein